jgi:hypothetical protein
VSGVIENKVNPIDYWTRKGIWPGEYFEQDDQTRKDFEKDGLRNIGSNMSHLLARKKPSSSLRTKQSDIIVGAFVVLCTKAIEEGGRVNGDKIRRARCKWGRGRGKT